MGRSASARPATLTEEWRHLARVFDTEHQEALQAVVQRAERMDRGLTADAAFLAILVDYELELQRILARLSWLESDADVPRVAERRREREIPPGWRRLGPVEEDDVEGDPAEEADLVAMQG